MKLFNGFISALVVSVFVLSGILASTPAMAADYAKQIIMARNEDSRNLDPVTQDGNVNIWMFNLVLEGLVKTNNEGTKIEPALAESWDVSEDGLTWTFHLLEGTKFSDGTPVKGEDWVWSLLRARDTEESTWKFALEAVADVTAPDDKTVVVKLKEPWAPILADLAMFNCTVQSKAYYNKLGAQAYTQKPLGTGPYMFAEWKKGEYMILKKNPHYRVVGLPKTETIRVNVVPDDNTRVMQLQAGAVDIITFVPYNRMNELNKDPNLKAVGVPSTSTRYIVLNNNVKPFDNVKVRKALQHGTNKEAIVAFVLHQYGEPAKGYAPKSGLYYNDDLKPYEYDVAKAKKLLAEAGYPNGFKTEILVRSGNAVYEQIATILKEQWAQIGVQADIQSLESATAVAKYRAMNHQVTLSGWTNDINDPSQQVNYVVLPGKAHKYYTDWTDTKAAAIAEAANRELDPAKREKMYKEIQAIHYDESPMIPVFHATYPVAMKKSIKGFVQTPLGNYRFENLVKEQ
ncbi:MAG: ABC transporter substrate-binding protein [Desulfobacterales bacterium]|jgi:peptide/nickel transport system substrate-binding protein